MGDEGQAEWSELMSAVHRSVHTQKYLLTLCWVTTLPSSHAADGFTVLLHEVRTNVSSASLCTHSEVSTNTLLGHYTPILTRC